MKYLKLYGLSLLPLAALLSILPSVTPSANACAVVDATTQVSLHTAPQSADQQNNVNASHDDNCLGNAAVGTTTQVGVGAEPAQQTNQGNYHVGGGDINQTGLTSPYIEVTPETQIDMQIPDANNSPALNGVPAQ